MNTLEARLNQIEKNVNQALGRSPHGLREVTIMGASKAQSINLIREAAERGVLDMGENYAQELLSKAPICMDTGIRWHFIGRLQSNKIKFLLPYISSIDSIDSLELAQKVGRHQEQARLAQGPVPILIQVNLGHERQKAGLSPEILEGLFPEFVKIAGVRLMGVMAIPPRTHDSKRARFYFGQMKEIFDRLRQKHEKPEDFRVLSMGMSHDYEVAVEEGSTCIRIGEALFGPRPEKATIEE